MRRRVHFCMTQSGGHAVTGGPLLAIDRTSFSDILLGFALPGYPPIVARISFIRLSKSSHKT